jgi:hypothetical protein
VRGSVKDKSFSIPYLKNEKLRGAFLLEQSFVEAKAAGALIANRSDVSTRCLGKEQLRISRLAMEVTGEEADFSQDPKFTETAAHRVYYGPVYLRRESDP